MHFLDNAAQGRYLINSLATEMGYNVDGSDSTEEAIADQVANLLHYARSIGLDPIEVADKGVRYYEGDEDQQFRPHQGGAIYHGTPEVLTEGTELKPGPHLHHVFGAATISDAVQWGRKKARGTGDVYVYEVQSAQQALVSETADILMVSAKVVRLIHQEVAA